MSVSSYTALLLSMCHYFGLIRYALSVGFHSAGHWINTPDVPITGQCPAMCLRVSRGGLSSPAKVFRHMPADVKQAYISAQKPNIFMNQSKHYFSLFVNHSEEG